MYRKSLISLFPQLPKHDWFGVETGSYRFAWVQAHAKVISKRGNGEFVEEIKINKNANLSRTIQQNIIGQVLNLNLNN